MNFCDKSANSQNILVVQSSVVLLLLVVCESVHSLLNALTNRVLLNNIELKCAVLLFFVTAGYCIVLYCIVLYCIHSKRPVENYGKSSVFTASYLRPVFNVNGQQQCGVVLLAFGQEALGIFSYKFAIFIIFRLFV